MPMNDLIIHKEHALSWIDKKYSALKKWLKPLSSNFPECLQSKGKRKTEKSLAATTLICFFELQIFFLNCTILICDMSNGT